MRRRYLLLLIDGFFLGNCIWWAITDPGVGKWVYTGFAMYFGVLMFLQLRKQPQVS